ncbi:helix-turn-helix transcriptional regulator [uncultured Cohaesibacter sp.]|uniref:helix-turn-helix domain-containing protein n=1 Tax=uncultured Cohaesibacter sp. TaxID=1002546 RepID=UPI002931B1B8|nr:helix-turn-helix transcriptional regulator [uncultured Cohaesibacter sp.]
MNQTLADRIETRLQDLNLSVTAAAKRVGKSRDLIRPLLLIRSRVPRADNLKLIAEALETSPEWLLEGKGPKEATDRVTPTNHDHFFEEQITLPRLGTVAAGLWREYQNTQEFPGEHRSHMSPNPKYPLNAQFTVMVDGPSINKQYPHGSELLCVELAGYGLSVEDLKNNDLVIIERHREDDGTFEYTAKYVFLNFDLNRIEFHPWSTDPNFQKPLVLPEHYRNAPDKEELIQVKDYESVFVKAIVISGIVPASAARPFG